MPADAKRILFVLNTREDEAGNVAPQWFARRVQSVTHDLHDHKIYRCDEHIDLESSEAAEALVSLLRALPELTRDDVLDRFCCCCCGKYLEYAAGWCAMPDPFAPSPAQPTVRAFRNASYGFPEVVLEAGEEKSAEVQVSGFFRGEKLIMSAVMDVVRGHFKIKHTRRGLLNRDDVFAFSEIKRRASKRSRSIPGRTVVSYQGEARSYLPKNVVYVPTDALEYVQLSQLYCGIAPAMASGVEVPAQLFGMGSFGTVLPLPSTKDASITILLKNVGDVQVRVRAMILGVQR